MAKRTVRRDRRNAEFGYPGWNRIGKGLLRIANKFRDDFKPAVENAASALNKFRKPYLDELSQDDIDEYGQVR